MGVLLNIIGMWFPWKCVDPVWRNSLNTAKSGLVYKCCEIIDASLWNRCCRLDYCGIALLTMGSFVPWLYYSFYCRFVPRLIYFIAIFILGTFCIVVSMWDKFAEPRYRPVRAGKSGIHFVCFLRQTFDLLLILDVWCRPVRWDTHLKGSFPGQAGSSGTRKVRPIWILMKHEMIVALASAGPYAKIICTLLQTGNHASTSALIFYRPAVLPDAQPTVSQHWR